MIIAAQFPGKLRFLFRPARYKVARGGRGSAKSWSFARALLLMGAERKLRILCVREVQLSIKQSVHKLLKDQIDLLGLSSEYQVLETEIRGRNGTEFTFTGLSTLTVDTIKSFEGHDYCWVEEGQTISQQSWRILIPTIRKDGSEIWISYNPALESDETHQRFTVNPPPDCVNVEINWRDNPFFNDVLDRERRHCLAYDPDNYDNIWEGKCKPAVEGAIYFKEIRAIEAEGRIRSVPYDPMLRVHLVYDLGWDDSLGVSLVQRMASEIRVIEYIEVSHTKLDVLSNEIKSRGYNWGRVWLPHDGFAGSLNSGGKSTYDILKALGWDCASREEIVETNVEEGIRYTRLQLRRFYFDKDKTYATEKPKSGNPDLKHTDRSHRLIESAKRYRRHINRQTEAAMTPVKDDNTHGADNIRYIALNSDKMHNSTIGAYTPTRTVRARRA